MFPDSPLPSGAASSIPLIRKGLGDSECVSSSLLLVRRGVPLEHPNLQITYNIKNNILKQANVHLSCYIIISMIVISNNYINRTNPLPRGPPRPNALLATPPRVIPRGRSFRGLPGPRRIFKGLPPGSGNF